MNEMVGDIDFLTASSRDRLPPSQLTATMLEELSRAVRVSETDHRQSGDTLREAMDYSLALRGKRVRGIFVLLIMDGWSKPWLQAMDCAHAIELVHTASLIVDDLPSMDDARTRRGAAANHVRFGEPVSILASIALLSEAHRQLASSRFLSNEQRSLAVTCLAGAVGPDGMTGGQLRDLYPSSIELEDVEVTHAMKTGSLFASAAELGCIAAGFDGAHRKVLKDFGMLLGKAFQEFDDLLDVACAGQVAGKDVDKDRGKPSFVNRLGLERAEKHAIDQISLALECLEASRIRSDELRRFTLGLTREMRSKIRIKAVQHAEPT